MTLIKRSNHAFPTFPSFFDDFLVKDKFHHGQTINSAPAVNIQETDHDFKIEVAAPGMKKEDFKLSLENHVLTISATHEAAAQEEKSTYTRKEFNYRSFKRSFTLPEKTVDSEHIGAQYIDGILTISVPKREEAKPKPALTIEVK